MPHDFPRSWRKKAFCAQTGPAAGAACCSSARHAQSLQSPCRRICDPRQTPACKPPKSHSPSAHGHMPVGCFLELFHKPLRRARLRHRPPLGVCADTDQSTATTCRLSSARMTRLHRVQARRWTGRAAAFDSVGQAFGFFIQLVIIRRLMPTVRSKPRMLGRFPSRRSKPDLGLPAGTTAAG